MCFLSISTWLFIKFFPTSLFFLIAQFPDIAHFLLYVEGGGIKVCIYGEGHMTKVTNMVKYSKNL